MHRLLFDPVVETVQESVEGWEFPTFLVPIRLARAAPPASILVLVYDQYQEQARWGVLPPLIFIWSDMSSIAVLFTFRLLSHNVRLKFKLNMSSADPWLPLCTLREYKVAFKEIAYLSLTHADWPCYAFDERGMGRYLNGGASGSSSQLLGHNPTSPGF